MPKRASQLPFWTFKWVLMQRREAASRGTGFYWDQGRSHQARGWQPWLSRGCNSSGDAVSVGRLGCSVVLGLAAGGCMHRHCLAPTH